MSNDATVELAKQLVALSEVIVRLATGEPDGEPLPVAPDRARARSPEADPPPASAAPGAHVSEPVAPTWSAQTEGHRPPPAPEPDARDALMQRLLALDRERRRLHLWMDAGDEAGTSEAQQAEQ